MKKSILDKIREYPNKYKGLQQKSGGLNFRKVMGAVLFTFLLANQAFAQRETYWEREEREARERKIMKDIHYSRPAIYTRWAECVEDACLAENVTECELDMDGSGSKKFKTARQKCYDKAISEYMHDGTLTKKGAQMKLDEDIRDEARQRASNKKLMQAFQPASGGARIELQDTKGNVVATGSSLGEIMYNNANAGKLGKRPVLDPEETKIWSAYTSCLKKFEGYPSHQESICEQNIYNSEQDILIERKELAYPKMEPYVDAEWEELSRVVSAKTEALKKKAKGGN